MKTTPSKLLLAVVCSIAITACDSDNNSQVQNVSAQSSAAKNIAAKHVAAKKLANTAKQQQLSYKNVDNAGLQHLLDQGVTLIDIRRTEEWEKTGLVPGSNALTFFRGNGGINPEFLPNLVQLADPNTPVALISDSGNRTQAASRTLADQLGYKKVYNVQGGIKQWIAEGRTVASLK